MHSLFVCLFFSVSPQVSACLILSLSVSLSLCLSVSSSLSVSLFLSASLFSLTFCLLSYVCYTLTEGNRAPLTVAIFKASFGPSPTISSFPPLHHWLFLLQAALDYLPDFATSSDRINPDFSFPTILPDPSILFITSNVSPLTLMFALNLPSSRTWLLWYVLHLENWKHAMGRNSLNEKLLHLPSDRAPCLCGAGKSYMTNSTFPHMLPDFVASLRGLPSFPGERKGHRETGVVRLWTVTWVINDNALTTAVSASSWKRRWTRVE